MFREASLLALILFLSVVVAIGTPINQARGVNINLSKRRSLTKADGTFDYERAIIEKRRTIAKYRRNLNSQRNHERPVVNVNGDEEIKERNAMALAPERLSRRQTEPLTDEAGENLLGNITIGTPGQTFLVEFDTGSSDLWVTSSSCILPVCASKNKYNAGDSSTAMAHVGIIEIKDGSSFVSGGIETDTVNVAGVVVNNQFFSPAFDLSNVFEGAPFDGIFGLGFPALSTLGKDSFIFNAFKQGAIPQNGFALKLASTGSSLYLGGTDSSLFTGSIEFHDVVGNTHWKIGGASITVGSQTLASGFQTIIDSGTTTIIGPSSVVREFYSKVPGSKFNQQFDLYTFPCSSAPSVSFSWGGKTWNIESSVLDLGTTTLGSSECFGAIQAYDSIGDNVWILGDSFMKNVYTVFSFDQNAIGFATLS